MNAPANVVGIEEFSDWQLNRIRDALRAYHSCERDFFDQTSFKWKDVREAIAYRTGFQIGLNAKVGAEGLRQFVEGLENKRQPGERRYRTPSKEALQAIVAFLTHEAVQYLRHEELQQHRPGVQAMLRLLEYLDDGSKTGRLAPPQKLQGEYRYIRIEGEQFSVRLLTLHVPGEDGLIEVTETHERYSTWHYTSYNSWSQKERRKHRVARIQHCGWAVLTPEDNLFFFLKNSDNKRNLYYYTLGAQTSLWNDEEPYSHLFLAHHEFPLELDAEQCWAPFVAERHVKEALAEKVLWFKRYDPGENRLPEIEEPVTEPKQPITVRFRRSTP
jgi:hypothetical protein